MHFFCLAAKGGKRESTLRHMQDIKLEKKANASIHRGVIRTGLDTATARSYNQPIIQELEGPNYEHSNSVPRRDTHVISILRVECSIIIRTLYS